VVLDDRAFAVIEDEHVVIREIATGDVVSRWAAPESSNLTATPWGDVLLVQKAAAGERLMQCRSLSGELRWSCPPPDFPWPAFAAGDFMVLAQSGSLRAYGRSGTVRWVAGHDGVRDPERPGDPVVMTDYPVRIDRDRVLVHLSWATGRGVFEVDGAEPGIRAADAVMRSPATTVIGPERDYLIVSALGRSDIGHMDYVWPLRLQRLDGTVIWEHRVPAEFDSVTVAPAGGFVVSGSPSDKIWTDYGQWQDLSDRTFARLIDADGDEVWTWYAPSLVAYSAVTDSDGTVYTGSDGKLFALVAPEAEDESGSAAVPLARTSHEAQVYLDLSVCECGESRFPRTSTTIVLPDGELGSRYTGTCPSCGAERTYVFRLPKISEDVSTEGEIVYGLGSRPSELLDAAQWLWVADRYAVAVPAHPERLEGQTRRVAKSRLMAATAAVGEAEKFVPDQAERVPDTALWSDLGRQMLAREPGRLDAARMSLRRESYQRVLRAMSP
jgi:hypothetical protein